MKPPIFANIKLQEEFDTEGIIRERIFTEAEVDELSKYFWDRHPQLTEPMRSGYYVSVYGGDKQYRKEFYDFFLPVLMPSLNKIFTDFKVIAIIGQVKGLGNTSNVNIHQDLTVVDESKYYCCTCWIPLINSTRENGAIFALRRSQQIARFFRAHTLDYQFSEVQDFVRENADCYPAAKGEVLVFDPATLHYSLGNTTDTPRASIALCIVSAKAPIQIGYFEKDSGSNDIELYDVPDDFWYRYDNFETERSLKPAFGKFNRIINNGVVRNYDKGQFINAYKSCFENGKQPGF
jgi:hypothetical protein